VKTTKLHSRFWPMISILGWGKRGKKFVHVSTFKINTWQKKLISLEKVKVIRSVNNNVHIVFNLYVLYSCWCIVNNSNVRCTLRKSLFHLVLVQGFNQSTNTFVLTLLLINIIRDLYLSWTVVIVQFWCILFLLCFISIFLFYQ